MIYLTFGDQYSGVYQSQVIDVIKFLRKNLNEKIMLIAYVPYSNFQKDKIKIQENEPQAIILPMIPSRNHWTKTHAILLFPYILKYGFRNSIWSRGIWATNIALIFKKLFLIKKIIFDGRGASLAEWKEYLNHNNSYSIGLIEKSEKKAIMQSDFRVSISNKLIEYWKENYSYNSNNHVVIPCTVSNNFFSNNNNTIDLKNQLGFPNNERIIVFSGGNDLWQSQAMVEDFTEKTLIHNSSVSFLFLIKTKYFLYRLQKKYPGKIITTYCHPNDVPKHLAIADFGLLLRENTETNRVASPTKFAEYLAVGLTPIITNNIGDISSFVSEKKIGIIINENFNFRMLDKIKLHREEMVQIAFKFFRKESFIDQYKTVLEK